MARLNRYELLDPEAIDTVHVYNRVVRRCLLFGDDPVTGKNYDQAWRYARCSVCRAGASGN